MIYQIKCTSSEHCEAVQRQLFANGYQWAVHGQKVREIEQLTIYVNQANKMMSLYHITFLAMPEEYQVITLSELLQL